MILYLLSRDTYLSLVFSRQTNDSKRSRGRVYIPLSGKAWSGRTAEGGCPHMACAGAKLLGRGVVRNAGEVQFGNVVGDFARVGFGQVGQNNHSEFVVQKAGNVGLKALPGATVADDAVSVLFF